MNRFKTFDVCIGFCDGTTSGAPVNPADRYRPPPENVDTVNNADMESPGTNDYDRN